MNEGIFVSAKSSRGHLAHALRVTSLGNLRTAWEEGRETVAACRGASPDILISESFDPDSETQKGHKTCEKCERQVRSHLATREFLVRWSR